MITIITTVVSEATIITTALASTTIGMLAIMTTTITVVTTTLKVAGLRRVTLVSGLLIIELIVATVLGVVLTTYVFVIPALMLENALQGAISLGNDVTASRLVGYWDRGYKDTNVE